MKTFKKWLDLIQPHVLSPRLWETFGKSSFTLSSDQATNTSLTPQEIEEIKLKLNEFKRYAIEDLDLNEDIVETQIEQLSESVSRLEKVTMKDVALMLGGATTSILMQAGASSDVAAKLFGFVKTLFEMYLLGS